MDNIVVPNGRALKVPPREKAGGHYAAGLLMQLPAPGVRFRCDSMTEV